ncbi:MFS transporter [Cellulomonas oligotrophica]|uniref:MFS family permease n=1 Tax=Cellulomonas oligotrophica TaxID=931536 RepID=A0A7Y9FH65_9CELL|nr:MFS transporter [Cellulomonas oligotrophica]NYD85876.1 MFS family permease [Cellulomonas oligotrophica]GIG31117.1 MFS transporter [Cellulomonas oligotrophica]
MSTTAPAPPRLGPRFHALVAASGAANLGDGVVQVAVPLLALGLTRAPGQIAMVSAAAWVPWLVLGLVAGVVVDRTDRRLTQTVALTGRAALLAGATALAATGRLTLPLLLVVVLAYGVTEVLADLAATALVPHLVTPALLPAANGRLVAVQQVANAFLGGPLAAGLLVLGSGWVLGVPAALAAVAAVVLLHGVPGTFGAVPDDAHARGRRSAAGAWEEARAGLGFVARHPVLRPVVLAGAVVNMASTAYFTVFTLWVVGPGSAVGMTTQTFPLLLVGLAVGAVAGSLSASGAARRIGEVRAMVGAYGVAFALLLVPVLVPHPAAVAGTLVAVGALSAVGNVVNETLRQRVAPPHLMGRVTGAGRTLVHGLMPVGALLAGAVAERAGLATALVGAVGLSVLAVGALASQVRQRDLPGPGAR